MATLLLASSNVSQFINPLPVFANAMRKSEAAIFVQLESKFRFKVGQCPGQASVAG